MSDGWSGSCARRRGSAHRRRVFHRVAECLGRPALRPQGGLEDEVEYPDDNEQPDEEDDEDNPTEDLEHGAFFRAMSIPGPAWRRPYAEDSGRALRLCVPGGLEAGVGTRRPAPLRWARPTKCSSGRLTAAAKPSSTSSTKRRPSARPSQSTSCGASPVRVRVDAGSEKLTRTARRLRTRVPRVLPAGASHHDFCWSICESCAAHMEATIVFGSLRSGMVAKPALETSSLRSQ